MYVCWVCYVRQCVFDVFREVGPVRFVVVGKSLPVLYKSEVGFGVEFD